MKRTVVVSGGGIGRAIARSVALSGGSAMIVGRRSSELRETAEKLDAQASPSNGGHVEAYPADLSELDSVLEVGKTMAPRSTGSGPLR